MKHTISEQFDYELESHDTLLIGIVNSFKREVERHEHYTILSNANRNIDMFLYKEREINGIKVATYQCGTMMLVEMSFHTFDISLK